MRLPAFPLTTLPPAPKMNPVRPLPRLRGCLWAGELAPAGPLLLQSFEGEVFKAFVQPRRPLINVINNHPDGPTDRSGGWGAGSKCRTKMKHRPNCADAHAHQKQILISAVSQCVAAPRHYIIGGRIGRLRECRAVLAEQHEGPLRSRSRIVS
jgi:hypothetical protein